MSNDRDAYGVSEFCTRFGFSRALLYKLWKSGGGPRRAKVGARIIITRQAATAWRQALAATPAQCARDEKSRKQPEAA